MPSNKTVSILPGFHHDAGCAKKACYCCILLSLPIASSIVYFYISMYN